MTIFRADPPSTSGLVRIVSKSGAAGAGFLISGEVVCTCAHVVADALNLSREHQPAPADAVIVEFPQLREAQQNVPVRRAHVATWRPPVGSGEGDVALLRLDEPVPGARPVPLIDGGNVWGHEFRVFGFPEGGVHGVWASGVLRDAQGAGWLQMDGRPGGPHVEAGFSGAPVWDDEQGGVVGMTVAAGRGRLSGTAYLIPSAALVDDEVLPPPCPFRGLEPFQEDHARFFHGRADDVARLRAAVTRRSVTVLTGPSGCGKSSLIRAGLLPAVRADGATVSLLRPVPGVRPGVLVAQAVAPLLELEPGETNRLRKADELARLLSERLSEGAKAEAAILLRSAVEGRVGASGHLFCVDQLEEYAAADGEAARGLFSLLSAAARLPSEPSLGLVATARAESLEVLTTPETSGLLGDAVEFLAPLPAEHLLEAVTRPVDSVAGVGLEAGLAERIVADAAEEPGRMPLVEFSLTRLWEKRHGAMLTHAGYEELGGVAGALAGHAENLLGEDLGEKQEASARRLFAQLARPDGRGSFSRRAAPVDDLDPGTVRLARRLAHGRLLIFGQTPEDTRIVELAHEALITHWPRLRGWLRDSEDFRSWQEQLRQDMTRWRKQHADPGGLLRGRPLAGAVDWLERRPDEITAAERAYIEASRRHQSRGVHRWQTAVAALLALTVLAAGLAVTAVREQHRTEEKLRTLASRTLAEKARSLPGAATGTAMQFALTAWHTEHTPQARKALLEQYVRGQHLRGSHTGLWQGRVQRMDATPDGRTLVLQNQPQGGGPLQITVVTGALSDTPRHYVLDDAPQGDQRSAVSPDGGSYAVGTPDGAVRLWRLTGERRDPQLLEHGRESESLASGLSLDFSDHGQRLLRVQSLTKPDPRNAGRRGYVDAWNVDDGSPLDIADDMPPPGGWLEDAAFGDDPDTVVIVAGSDSEGGVSLRRLQSGETVRRMTKRAGQLAAGGTFALEERDNPRRVYTHHTMTGASVRLPIRSVRTDATGSFATVTKQSSEGGYTEVALSWLQTGENYRTRVPVDTSPGTPTLLAALRRRNSDPIVLSPVGDSLFIARTRPAAAPEAWDTEQSMVHASMAPDMRRVARVTDTRLAVEDTVQGGLSTVPLPRREEAAADWRLEWTARGTRILAWQVRGTRLYSYDPDRLESRTEIPLDLGDERSADSAVLDHVVSLAGDEAALLTAGGTLVRVDAERGVPVGPAVRTGGTHVDPDRSFASLGRLRARPGHPYQIAVAGQADRREGTVQLWNLRSGTRLSELSGGVLSSLTRFEGGNNITFSSDGSELLVQTDDGRVHRWNPATQKKGESFFVGDDHLGPVSTGGTLLTSEAGAEFHLWNLHSTERLGTITTVNGDATSGILDGDRIVQETDGWRQSFALRPDVWFRSLCSAVGRAPTPDEERRLPPGTPFGPPCDDR